MTDTAASFDDVTFFGDRGSAYGEIRALVRSLIGSATMAAAAVGAVGASVAVVTVTGVWMVGVALSGNSHLQARAPIGPAALALADAAAFPQSSFEARWARTRVVLPVAARVAAVRRAGIQAAPVAARRADIHVARTRAANPTIVNKKVADIGWEFGAPKAGVLPAPHVKHEVASAPARARNKIGRHAGNQVAKLAPPAVPAAAPALPQAPTVPKPAAVARNPAIPLPLPRPTGIEVAAAPAAGSALDIAPATTPATKPAAKATPKSPEQIAALTPPTSTPAANEGAARPKTRHEIKAPALPGPESRTALYDISGHTVYLPDGTRLEAHSGLGSKMDNPRYIKVRMRGPTPPNVYDLTLRKQLFHGVRAIRLNPVHESKMFGRAGMLAHTYMLGPSGQSNGCVSFKHYHKFLQAFREGEIDRMVVVPDLDAAPANLASLVRAPRHRSEFRYVAANERSPSSY